MTSKAQSGQVPGAQMYGYYNGMFHAGRSIWKGQGPKGLYAGYVCCWLPYMVSLDLNYHLTASGLKP